MSIHCPKCHQKLVVPGLKPGTAVKCPACRTTFNLPDEKAGEQAVLPKNKPTAPVDEKPPGPVSKRVQQINPEELIDMTAMVDIVFFLLIFFLVTSMASVHSSTPMPHPDTHSDEPGAKSTNPDTPPVDPDAIIVNIGKDDMIEIDGVPFRNLTDLAIRLQQLKAAASSELSLLIIGHGESTHGTTVGVFDVAYEVGISKLRLAVIDNQTE
jgi:biopolymer transport protein ExbD